MPVDPALLARAQRVVLKPLRGRAVFYHGVEGSQQADLFVGRNPGHTRIEELLRQSAEGAELLHRLGRKLWVRDEGVWWELSRKLARAASGDVHCFGPDRLGRESRFVASAYADTVFEKVELPELENNRNVETIYYNGAPLL